MRNILALTLLFAISATSTYAQWTKLSTPLGTNDDLFSIDCKNADSCIIVGAQSVFLGTNDGGANWVTKSAGIFANFGRSVHYAEGDDWYCAADDQVYYSINNGNAWTSVKTDTACGTAKVNVVHAKDGFVGAGSSCDKRFYTSPNSGGAWDIHNPVSAGTATGVYKVQVFDANTIYALISKNRITTTTDGGMTWVDIFKAMGGILDFWFKDPNLGYVVGVDGRIHKTTNAGMDWTLQTTPISEDINSISCLNENVCYTSSDASLIMFTTDGGTTWTKDNTGIEAGLRFEDIVIADASTVYAVAQNGIVYKNTLAAPLGVREAPYKMNAQVKSRHGILEVSVASSEKIQFTLTDVLGRTVITKSISGFENIQVQHLSAGTYFYLLTNDQGSKSGKVSLAN